MDGQAITSQLNYSKNSKKEKKYVINKKKHISTFIKIRIQ